MDLKWFKWKFWQQASSDGNSVGCNPSRYSNFEIIEGDAITSSAVLETAMFVSVESVETDRATDDAKASPASTIDCKENDQSTTVSTPIIQQIPVPKKAPIARSNRVKKSNAAVIQQPQKD